MFMVYYLNALCFSYLVIFGFSFLLLLLLTSYFEIIMASQEAAKTIQRVFSYNSPSFSHKLHLTWLYYNSKPRNC